MGFPISWTVLYTWHACLYGVLSAFSSIRLPLAVFSDTYSLCHVPVLRIVYLVLEIICDCLYIGNVQH